MRQSKKSILFMGHCYYNHWYLSRDLRKLGWRADVLNIDTNPESQMYYHGQDYNINKNSVIGIAKDIIFFFHSIFYYRIFHFSNADILYFPPFNRIRGFHRVFGRSAEIKLLRVLGKKIIYTNNGCRDGVLQSSFNLWGPEPVCDICPWKNNPNVCSDKKNKEWGELRNSLVDYIGLLGGNRADYNISSKVHEAPWMYSLDKHVWSPETLIPANYILPFDQEIVKIYHAVGNYDTRSHGTKKITIKSTEIWVDIVKRLKGEGLPVELIFFKDVPNKTVKYYQLQADVFVDMLTFGFFGANIREAMMLGKPAICYLRPEWLESMRREIPDYVNELPVISATTETAYNELRTLVLDRTLRTRLGKKMRAFGEKWHASDVAAIKADQLYSEHLVDST